MTRVQYKNWKSEIAWLRKIANKCIDLQSFYAKCDPDASDDFETLHKSLMARADSLEVAKGAVQQ